MLSDLQELQSRDEDVRFADLSISIETRCDVEDELVRKKYTFQYAGEWDKWVFGEFEEKRTDDTKRVSDRNWRRSRHVLCTDVESHSIDVPPEVTEAMEKRLSADTVVLQEP